MRYRIIWSSHKKSGSACIIPSTAINFVACLAKTTVFPALQAANIVKISKFKINQLPHHGFCFD